MPKTPTIYYVTSNEGKFKEVAHFIQAHHPELHLEQKNIELVEIQSDNQEEIARYKAQQAWDIVQSPVLIDDNGFYIDKYHLFPGTICKQVYYGLKFEGLCKLYEPGDTATRRLTLVYQTGPTTQHVFEGIVTGTLCYPSKDILHPKLPFNTIFIPQGCTQTKDELMRQGKGDQYSERIKALELFIAFMKKGPA